MCGSIPCQARAKDLIRVNEKKIGPPCELVENTLSGTRLVWEINLRRKSVAVYTPLTDKRALTEADTLDGGEVLPGFALPLGEFFANLSRRT